MRLSARQKARKLSGATTVSVPMRSLRGAAWLLALTACFGLGLGVYSEIDLVVRNDSDRDGLLDAFEEANGFAPDLNQDAAQDFDGDELSNLVEGHAPVQV